MPSAAALRVVIDTNVVFEGLTQQGGAAGLIIDAWLADLMTVYVSNALAYEYADVFSRLLSEQRWRKLEPVLGSLLSKAHFITVFYSWRPISPDKGDEHVIDCAMNAGAAVITSNIRHFRKAQESLGLEVMTPLELVLRLADE
jgi:predicted nucleic acid-binding protein